MYRQGDEHLFVQEQPTGYSEENEETRLGRQDANLFLCLYRPSSKFKVMAGSWRWWCGGLKWFAFFPSSLKLAEAQVSAERYFRVPLLFKYICMHSAVIKISSLLQRTPLSHYPICGSPKSERTIWVRTQPPYY